MSGQPLLPSMAGDWAWKGGEVQVDARRGEDEGKTGVGGDGDVKVDDEVMCVEMCCLFLLCACVLVAVVVVAVLVVLLAGIHLFALRTLLR